MAFTSEYVTGLRQPYGGIHLDKAHDMALSEHMSGCSATNAQDKAIIGSLAEVPVPAMILIPDSFTCCVLSLQARALTAQVAETDAIRFLVGTQSLRFENQVSV